MIKLAIVRITNAALVVWYSRARLVCVSLWIRRPPSVGMTPHSTSRHDMTPLTRHRGFGGSPVRPARMGRHSPDRQSNICGTKHVESLNNGTCLARRRRYLMLRGIYVDRPGLSKRNISEAASLLLADCLVTPLLRVALVRARLWVTRRAYTALVPPRTQVARRRRETARASSPSRYTAHARARRRRRPRWSLRVPRARARSGRPRRGLLGRRVVARRAVH